MSYLTAFVAGFLSTLFFHQGALAVLHAAGFTTRAPYVSTPTWPLHLPAVVSLAFWGGVWAGAGAILVFLAAVPVNLLIYGAPLPMHMTQDAWEVAKAVPYTQVRRDILVGLFLPAEHVAIFLIAAVAVDRLLQRRSDDLAPARTRLRRPGTLRRPSRVIIAAANRHPAPALVEHGEDRPRLDEP